MAEGAAHFRSQAHSEVGPNLDGIDFDNIKYFVRSTEKQAASWDDEARETGTPTTGWEIPSHSRLVAGVAAYIMKLYITRTREDLEAQGSHIFRH